VSHGRASALAWSSAALALALVVTGGVVALAAEGGLGDFVLFFVLVSAVVAAGAVVGGLVGSRRPENPIGWIFCGFAVFMGVATLAAGYAEAAPDGATHGVGQWAAWFANWSFVALFVLAVSVLLLFPDGRLLSPRWRLALWCGAAAALLLAAGAALDAGRLTDFPDVTNPVGADPGLVSALELASLPPTIASFAAAIASVVLRYRRAGDVERHQIKWLAAAGAFTGCLVAVGIPVAIVGPDALGYSMVLLGVLAIPVAIGVAILRYRLYDVDRVISRTLTYGVLTVALGAAYALLVLAGQALFSSFAGGGDLAIAASTLVVAALFLPARSRVQGFVDRRFYRRRYDARRTLEAFGTRLRERVELEGLRVELEGAVRETMQPSHVSVWLKEESP
jgi:hypothetical protein